MSEDLSAKLDRLLRAPYSAYAYAYPHKTAYRALRPAPSLVDVWYTQPRQNLFGYVHIPFCSYRCGFCNLFALGAPKAELVDTFLAALTRQIKVVASALGEHQFARFAIGGGTPSYLSAEQFSALMTTLAKALDVDFQRIPFGIEVAPDSATPERLLAYKNAGVKRVSMGVQSFVDSELDALARPRQREAVIRAMANMRALGFASVNLDLIYGIQGQSVASFLSSLESALALAPDELYLYPLYVRALTGLDKVDRRGGLNARAECYARAVPMLRAAGYQQHSMRMFSKRTADVLPDLPEYSCQNDGMVGLGCGARSYTQTLHYSEDYAVARTAVSSIIQRYVNTSDGEFAQARYGFALNDSEQRRRYLSQSLLIWPGLSRADYQARFGSDVWVDFPQLSALSARALMSERAGVLALTEAGMGYADAIGPWLVSDEVDALMAAYEQH
jgi:oxygen-independent coproporphyrinogen III oxidase